LPAQIKDASDINVNSRCDSDMVDDRFWCRSRMCSASAAIRRADNGAMVQNFVENMMGSNGLISLRTRERNASLHRGAADSGDAETRYRAQEEALQQKVSTTEASLRALQRPGGPEGTAPSGTPVLRSSSRLRSTNLRRDLVETRHRSAPGARRPEARR